MRILLALLLLPSVCHASDMIQLGLSDGIVTTAKLGAGSVTSSKIGDGEVTTAKLAAGSVTTSKLAQDAVTDTAILTASVTTSKLSAGAVTTSKLATGLLEPLTIDQVNTRIGVGSTSPAAKLDVRNATADGIFVRAGDGSDPSFYVENGVGSVALIRVQADGLTGFGTGSPCSTCTVHVAGTMNITGNLRQGGLRSCATGTQTDADGLFSACVASDRSLKRDIRAYSIEADAIDKLKPVAYRWKDANRDTRQHIGFVAQDVEKILPSAVVSAGTGLKGIDPNALISALVLELQALRRRVKALEK